MLLKVDTKYRMLYAAGTSYRCAVGKNGSARLDEKIEGDGKTPTGIFPILNFFWRADRFDEAENALFQKSPLPHRPLQADDGWCDDPNHAKYNQPVLLPFDGRHEKLWREDRGYDVIVVIGHNIQPIIRGKGSAIFLHCTVGDYQPTEGCVALSHADMLAVLPYLDSSSRIDIR